LGIRLALGATPSQMLHMVIGYALKLAAAGIAIGAVVALALSPVLEAQLFGVRPVDPLTYAAVALALVLTSVLAALLPARRAMRVDPVHALRAT
jgi:ABC-type antimicrobial peptide transport system permease subunit